MHAGEIDGQLQRIDGSFCPFERFLFRLWLGCTLERIQTLSATLITYVPNFPLSGCHCCGGVCMMSNTWKDEQNPSFINFISCFLSANSFRLNFVPIAPVTTVLNSSSTLVQFITQALTSTTLFAGFYLQLWRVQKLKGQFAHLYVVVTLPTKERNDSFVHSYFTYDLELGRPTFIPVQDLEMGFEKIVKIAHARGVCKRQDGISKLKAEREKTMQTMDHFLRVVTAIPGVDNHDANSVLCFVASNLSVYLCNYMGIGF
ncbi:hypothetical protein RJ639_047659 [Escallonia herrerae]|uniref:Uncharacterized protein n=1 Tax=Escallonia herrerae TaxID=1293975 RepID=A0AA88W3Z6_9ASTE|nr:hypothetical protein RJ639_047659 [Escallonia herrerae]